MALLTEMERSMQEATNTASAVERTVSSRCRDFYLHQWQAVKKRRVPAHGAYGMNMPKEPNGTVEYVDYVCERCGEKWSEETLHSWRANKAANVETKGRERSDRPA